MSTPLIKTHIIKIGNSRGIRIPKILLDQTNLGDEVELSLHENKIVIQSSQPTRYTWDEQFRLMAEQGDDYLLDDEIVSTDWDEEDWEW
jgi:antitoxin MazE